jgi:FkbM family methyltransferase
MRLRPYVRHIPVLAAFQRMVLEWALGDEPFEHEVNAGPAAGLRMIVRFPTQKSEWGGTYELDFAVAIRSAVAAARDPICYDIGGFVGYMSGVMALAGAQRVLTFEPLPANQQSIRQLCELNPLLRISLITCAVGKRDGNQRLDVMQQTSMAKLDTSPFQKQAKAISSIETAVRSIDSLVYNDGLPPPGIMKVDVEGAELQVLQGATRTIAAHKPTVLIEIHSRDLLKDCAALLRDHRYQVDIIGDMAQRDEQTCHIQARP